MLRGSNIRITQGGTITTDKTTQKPKVSGGQLVALCTGCKISATTNTEDAAVKTDANHVAVSEVNWDTPSISGKSWNVSVDKLLSPTGAEYTADKATFLADTNVVISFEIGTYTFFGYAILSGDSISGQNKQNATSSVTFTGNGQLYYTNSGDQ